jgi:deoxyribose-phosphate aldolase
VSSRNSFPKHEPEKTTWQAVAAIIDHTSLRPEATGHDIVRLCEEAKEFGFGTVMVNAGHVKHASSILRGSNVKVGAVAGFPLGATLTSVKCFESSEALKRGALEIDMVMNIGALKSGDWDLVLSDIEAVTEVVHAESALLKIILETGLLTEGEKRAACALSEKAGADFVKTSTGFLGGVATLEDVALMRRTVKIGVKASGGIRTASDARAMIAAGADRLGTSSGVKIVSEWRDHLDEK